MKSKLSSPYLAVHFDIRMGVCKRALKFLVISLSFIARVDGSTPESNKLQGQHLQHFLRKYREELQTYMMTGSETGRQHCDLLTSTSFRDNITPRVIMDLENMDTFNKQFDHVINHIAFSSSHCLLIAYQVNTEDELSTLADFGQKMFPYRRAALIITVGSNINLDIVTNSTNLPFLVAVQFDDGDTKFICPVVGEDKPPIDLFMCKLSHVSYKHKSLRIGIVGFAPYFVPTKSGLDGIDIRLLQMLSERLYFTSKIVIPYSFNAAYKMVGT